MDLDEPSEERIVRRTSSKEKRGISELSSREGDKGNLHDELYFDREDDYPPEVDDKFLNWKGQRRGAGGRYRNRWPGRRMSFGRSRVGSRGSRREDLDEGEIFELATDNAEGNEVLDEWVVEGTEFANDGSLIVEEYVLDDESLQAGLQRYNSKYLRGRGGFRRASRGARKSYERQRPYEKYEIIDDKTFGNYATRTRGRSPAYRDNDNYREPYDAEANPHGSREWSKRGWSREDNAGYRKKSLSPNNPAAGEDERYSGRGDSGKQYYDPRYLSSSKALEGGESPAARRKGAHGKREEGSPAADAEEYSPVASRKHGWTRDRSPSAQHHSQERSWPRNRRELSPPAAYKLRSQSPPEKRRAYSPSVTDKRESSPKRSRGKDGSPKKRGRSISPHQRGSTVSSGKGGHSVSPVGRKSGKSSRKRSPPSGSRKRGRSSSSSSSQGGRSSRSDSRDSPERGADGRDEHHSSYSSRAGAHSRDPRRAGSSVGQPAQQDTAWKQPVEPAHDYSAMHQQHQQFGMDSGGMASAAASTVYPGTYTAYAAQPDMSAAGYHQAGHAGYDMYNYQAYYQQSAMQPTYGGEFVPHQVHPEWSEAGVVLPDMTQPPPLQHQMSGSHETEPESKADLKKSEEARKEAIKKEQKEQKLTLIKQREEYFKKSGVLMRELELLREQKEELLEEKSCDNDRILKENGKLQLEIQNKLKAINNVIDMLTGIIGDKKDKKEEKRKSTKEESKSEKHKSSEAKSKVVVHEEDEEEIEDPVYNYVYYDPEVHWCRVCDVFPRTAKEYLHHLHCTEHKELTAKKKMVDMPWHKNKAEPEVPYYKGAPSKRTSIKGLQFLISVSAWYCKLCDTWIGDLHCVSLHLKSKLHLDNYKDFTDKNPKWELEWLAEREQAFQRKNEEKLHIREGSSKGHMPLDFESKVKEENDSEEEREGPLLPKMPPKEKAKSSGGTWAEVVAAPARVTRIPTTTALGGVAHRTKPRTVLGGDDSSESEEGEVKTGRSIRVSMRNKPKMGLHEAGRNSWTTVEPGKGTIKVKGEVGDSEEEGEVQKSASSRRDEKSFQEWMPKAPATISDDDRQLLSNIKDRLKQKQEAEKEKDEEKVDEKDKKNDREAKKMDEKAKPEHDRYERGRSWDRDRSPDKDWYRERDRRDRSRERSRERKRGGRSKRYGSTSPRRRSPDRRGRYDKKYDSYKDRRRERGDFRSDSRPERDLRDEKVFPPKVEELEKKFDPFSKKEKKPEPKPVKAPKKPPPDPNLSKTKLPFIGRMPLLKHIAKKKGPGGGSKGEDGKDDADAEGGAPGSSPSHEGGKDGGSEEMGKIEGVQDMDIDDDNSDTELGDSQEKDGTYMQDEEASKDGLKQDIPPSGIPGSEANPNLLMHGSEAPTSVAPVVTKVSRFGPLMEMSSGPKLLTSFDQPSGVQIQLCNPVRLSSVQPGNALMPPGTMAETPAGEMGETKPKKVVDEIPLPKDFQDALNILFPEKSAMGEQNPLAPPGVSTPPGVGEAGDQDGTDPHAMMQHMGMPMPHGIPHGMHGPMDPSAHHHMYSAPPPMHMPPPMHQMAMGAPPAVLMSGPVMGANPMEQQMVGAMEQHQQMAPMVQEGGDEGMSMPGEEMPAGEPEVPEVAPEKAPRKKYMEMGEDELAMLGIDPEDMAAQTFAPQRPYP
ncbi:zinc finger matrin-type protein CG9776-like isoform X2 [Ischnura elegans]|uniref:zinc finger matrin-type protein CG9776-like isoform X2 n=1 Tax=Ischnura elegans TaxID=197161 RepID=UPI001ED8AF75|nr:zinc finger matrin-type protein CG9776-like isoform X2 [Ischnura elegans]